MPLTTTGTLPVEALQYIRSQGAALKGTLEHYKNLLATQSATLDTARDIYMSVQRSLEALAEYGAVPGLNEYARIAYNEPTVDVVSDVNAVIAAAGPLWAFFLANAPTQLPVKDPSQWQGGIYQDAIYAPESQESTELRGLLDDIAQTIA